MSAISTRLDRLEGTLKPDPQQIRLKIADALPGHLADVPRDAPAKGPLVLVFGSIEIDPTALGW
jgi:hypothetical protein